MDIHLQSKLDKFFSNYKKQKYGEKEILIRAEAQPAGVFYLTHGVVKMYAISSQGEELVINTFRPVSFFPMSWVLNDSLSHYYFESLTPTTVWKAPKEDFLSFLEKNPEILLDLVKRIYMGLEGYFSRMEYLMSGSAHTRLITEILIYAKRFGEKTDETVTINLKLTEKDLASQTGIARETVSRELTKLREKGLIIFRKNILIIKDLVKLEDELSVI